MQNKDISNLVFNIKSELSSITPNVWSEIYKKLAKQISRDLLEQLNQIPSPNGRLIYERKKNLLENINKIGA